MRLVHSEYNLSLEIEENQIVVLVIEKTQLRWKLVMDIRQQCIGEESGFVLSDGTQILKMSKVADFLTDPFSVQCNNKKAIAKLYQEIQERGMECFSDEKQKINSEIISLLERITINVPYNITTKLELDWLDICKIYNVQLENTGETLLEQLMEYIKVMGQLCGIRLFCLLNFSMYLSGDEIRTLHEYASGYKVHLLFIEYEMPTEFVFDKGCIIDRDGCIIDIDNRDLQHMPSVKFGDDLGGFEV